MSVPTPVELAEISRRATRIAIDAAAAWRRLLRLRWGLAAAGDPAAHRRRLASSRRWSRPTIRWPWTSATVCRRRPGWSGGSARPPAGHRPGRTRPALAHDLRGPRVAGGGRHRRAAVGQHRRPARAGRRLLPRQHRLDDHDGDQRHADLPLRAARAGGHRGARPEPHQHDLRARRGRLADLRARDPGRDAGHRRTGLRGGRARARHEPPPPRSSGRSRPISCPPSW